MSEPSADEPPARSDEERAELFDELMRLEHDRPVNKLAIAALVTGVLGGLLAPFFAVFAWSQIKDRDERGKPLVFLGWAGFTVWAVIGFVALGNQLFPPGPERVNGFDLRIGDCFEGPGGPGEPGEVPRLPCTEWHNGEVFADYTVPDGAYPGALALFEDARASCAELAVANTKVPGPNFGEVLYMAPRAETWEQQDTHRIVCYFRYKNLVNHPS